MVAGDNLFILAKAGGGVNAPSWARYNIPIAKPLVTDEDISEVVSALRGGHLSSGEYVAKFEREFAGYIGAKHAVAVNSGTAALEIALKSLGVTTGDEVITPSFTIAATSNAVVNLGARPVFVEIEDETYNIDPLKIQAAITSRTKVIMPIHYAGQSCQIDEINEIASKHGIFVVEDAAPAAGAEYKGKRAGVLGTAAGFSFFPDKNLTTGEGGMLTTNNADIAEKASYLRKHGAPTRYYNIEIGWNYKMPDFCAAMGTSQLKRLDDTIKRKNELAQRYSRLLSDAPGIKTPFVRAFNRHTFMLYAIRTKGRRDRDRIKSMLENGGIETRINFPPVHLQPIYRRLFGYKEGYLPLTEAISDSIISLPIYLSMTEDDQNRVAEIVKEALR